MNRRIPKRATIRETWRCVYRYAWRDADDPTMINVEEIYCHEGRYVVVPSFGSRPTGPYADLFETVGKYEFDIVMGSAVAVDCPEVETASLAKRLSCYEDLRTGSRIQINGDWYQVTPARIFGRCRKQDGAGDSDTRAVAISWRIGFFNRVPGLRSPSPWDT